MSAIRDAQFAREIGRDVEAIRDLLVQGGPTPQPLHPGLEQRVTRMVTALEDKLKQRFAQMRAGKV